MRTNWIALTFCFASFIYMIVSMTAISSFSEFALHGAILGCILLMTWQAVKSLMTDLSRKKPL